MTEQEYAEQQVTYKPHMVSLLRRLQSARAVVTVRINNDTALFNTMVIDVSVNDDVLFLDEITTPAGHRKIKKGATLHFDGRLKGVRIQFSSKVQAVETDISLALYRIALPDNLLYWQRRRHYRARVYDEPLAIVLPLPLKKQFTGKIMDISASGLCTRLDYPASAVLESEQAIQHATITMPGRSEITCDLELRSIRHFPQQGYSLVGSEFIEISPHQQNHVERIVAMLDRNHRRTN